MRKILGGTLAIAAAATAVIMGTSGSAGAAPAAANASGCTWDWSGKWAACLRINPDGSRYAEGISDEGHMVHVALIHDVHVLTSSMWFGRVTTESRPYADQACLWDETNRRWFLCRVSP
ncbi:hypothetical protein EV193_105409 [Herbihabitans rhizosphaerae]|uniref:Peptidase inhibitor family I36 n=1 Tax=Herbihabitans rhizosphaerae TaxID=1872711 RepID=A0A4Q7KME0_9PSEU|nr:hypothetical protein [Herbihabitans rhizosphaerae]RZS37849.1 hypothetical protein EV193_105409 [Herbihabitans rhizosphaerae]